MNQYATIPGMFLEVCENYGDKDAYGYKEDGKWKTLSFRDIRNRVEELACGLSSLGVEKGDRVAILSSNNPRWAISDYAITSLGGVTVTIYPTLTPKQIRFILDDSQSKVVFVENREQGDKILTSFDRSDFLKSMVVMNDDRIDGNRIDTFQGVLDLGKSGKEAPTFDFAERANSVVPGDLLTLVYTSGTTGDPKGVMLTHNNLISNVKAALEMIPINEQDVFLSFLPLSHSFERMAGHYTSLAVGATVYYAESIETVAENISEVKPTVMASVPRLYEKMYARVLEKVDGDPPLRQKVFWWAVGVGRKGVEYRQRGQPVPAGLKIRSSVADKLVFSKLKQRLGGRLRFFVSGAAPLSAEIGEFFASADIIILEGYGLTETSPVMTVNCLDSFKFGTVGVPIPGVEVKITDDGEILNRGPNSMKGYFNNEKATREVIDDDGWLHTGDVGRFDEDGFLVITDRKKNLLVTSGGKNVAPGPLENALLASKWVEQCLVIGDRRKFVSALVVPSFEALEAWAKEKGIMFQNRDELIGESEVEALFNDELVHAMEDFARYETVKKIVLLPREWSIADNELTPTLKVKRKVVVEKYKKLIDSIYEEAS